MTTDDYWKKCLIEADVKDSDHVSATKILGHLRTNHEAMRVNNPPPGYEEQLLSNLKRFLPEEKKAPERQRRSSWLPQFSQAWGWGLGMATAALLGFVVYTQNDVKQVAHEKNYLEFVGGDEESAQNWLATVSDSGFRLENSQQDLQGMAIQISKDENLMKKMNKAIAQWEH